MKGLVSTAVSIAFAATAIFALGPTPEAEAGASYYKIHCRGPYLLMHAPGGNPQVVGKKSSSKAGQHGKLLAEGTCAWKDRAMNSNEAPNIVFAGSDSSHAFLAPMLSTCSLDEDCILAAMARSHGPGAMITHAGQTVAIRPYEGTVGNTPHTR